MRIAASYTATPDDWGLAWSHAISRALSSKYRSAFTVVDRRVNGVNSRVLSARPITMRPALASWTSHPCRSAIVLLAIHLMLQASAGAQAKHDDGVDCDKALLALARGENGYQTRNEWCEGLYAKSVASGDVLSLIGLSQTLASHAEVSDVLLSWSNSTTDSIWIAAESTRPNRQYGMTVRKSANTRSHTWPLGYAKQEGLGASDFAYKAWRLVQIRNRTDTIYLPLKLSIGSGSSYTAVVVASTTLAALEYRIGELGTDGLVRRWIVPGTNASETRIPQRSLIPIAIPANAQPGILKITLGGETLGGDPVSLNVLLELPRRP
jgi:hypothetical protein